ncbi:LysM peptidoglycan-binding domain-containing protein [Arthrobacter sp.]|uniref:LysM peptidoglycan-binding domain-containing protein n=1 Tax=Arthrobacter sp. TaxID=1667 RepID=UPI0026E059F0|nr:LysM peptidoglycan-binding domain-containing protein [Arthrobacter sp.]MDO5752169.1 LysM peptidoglycan-binding domain-containing protein [Arthrobacter sp.]
MNAILVSTAVLSSEYNSHHTTRTRTVRTSTVRPSVILPGVDSTGVAAKSKHSLQLTRRGRLVLLGVPALALAAVVVLVSMAFVFGSTVSPAHASVQYPAVDMADYARTVTVLQGESLWSIAAASDPNRDVREVVSEILALNELGTGVLQAGQQLFVPLPN